MISRRAWIVAAVVAVATGAGLSAWRRNEEARRGAAISGSAGSAGSAGGTVATPAGATASASATTGTSTSASATANSGTAAPNAIEQLFSMQLTDPTGAPMPMSQFRNKRLVVNFWATWCPPCVEEMPELSEMAHEFNDKDVEFVGIAIDQPANVGKFLQKVPVKYPIAIAGSAGLAMVTALGNAQGGLPFTLVLNTDGTVRERYLGKVEMPALRQVLTS